MAAREETAYPVLLDEPRPRELSDHYTPTSAELQWAKRHIPEQPARAGLLITLKCVQRLGRFQPIASTQRPYVDHVTAASGYQRRLTKAEIQSLDGRRSREKFIDLCRARLDIRPIDDDQWLNTQAIEAAKTHFHYVDILNVLVEVLIRHRYELPGFTVLVRVARQAQGQIDDEYFTDIADGLTAARRRRIDRLFETTATSATSAWNVLKSEPGKPTNQVVRKYLEHVRYIQDVAEGLPPVDIPAAKFKHYRTLARALNAAEMQALKPAKKYALAVIYIRACLGRALDDAADLFIRIFDKMEASAKARLRAYQLESAEKADELILRFYKTLQGYERGTTVSQRMHAIDETLGDDVAALKAMCEEHLTFADRNYLPFMQAVYPQSRSILLNCLRIVQPQSTTGARTIADLVDVLNRLKQSRHEVVRLRDLGVVAARDLDWMSGQWRKLVFGTAENAQDPEAVHRVSLELAILEKVRTDLRNGDLFVAGGEKYNDYREQLVDQETFDEEVDDYGEVTGIEVDSKAMVSGLKGLLTQRAREVDRAFMSNDHAWITNGRLSLSRVRKTVEPREAEQLDLEIRNRLMPISILDALVDVERWLNLHRHFKSLSGTDTRIPDLRKRFVTALFCYGCNLGTTQTSRSIKGVNRKNLSWLNLRYVTEESLDKAITEVTNVYAKFELPGYWGNEKSASADGMKWGLYEKNMLSEYHIRYGGYGGIGYYHVSDKYIALFSRFIPCGVYEGVHILDGLVENESDIQPDTLHGDTHSQNYAVFAIAHMLGIRLMPRIRGIKKLSFFRPSRSEKYKNIDDLFGPAIDWRLIERHFQEMLRVVVSIRMGRITASTMLRRFGSTNRSQLAMAFRELGKVIRTLFLLGYVESEDLRKVIGAATNKSESFNNFIRWVFFGSEGIIQENIAHEQRKLIKYSHLVANMLCLHNVQAMTREIIRMRSEGIQITPGLLAYLSPYRTWHINRFGDYALDYDRPDVPMDVGLKIFLPE